MTQFNLKDHMKHLDVITEIIEGTERSKKVLKLDEQLELILYDSGQATLAYRHIEVETFWWDDEAERLFADIDNVKISDLFAMMYSKRWVSSVV